MRGDSHPDGGHSRGGHRRRHACDRHAQCARHARPQRVQRQQHRREEVERVGLVGGAERHRDVLQERPHPQCKLRPGKGEGGVCVDGQQRDVLQEHPHPPNANCSPGRRKGRPGKEEGAGLCGRAATGRTPGASTPTQRKLQPGKGEGGGSVWTGSNGTYSRSIHTHPAQTAALVGGRGAGLCVSGRHWDVFQDFHTPNANCGPGRREGWGGYVWAGGTGTYSTSVRPLPPIPRTNCGPGGGREGGSVRTGDTGTYSRSVHTHPGKLQPGERVLSGRAAPRCTPEMSTSRQLKLWPGEEGGGDCVDRPHLDVLQERLHTPSGKWDRGEAVGGCGQAACNWEVPHTFRKLSRTALFDGWEAG
eukprot:364457-Chlamydomonas_euryale.AAC.2